MERVGLIFLDRPSLGQQVELVRYAEQRGFESAWVCETRLARDAMTPLAAFAQATSRIRLATGVVNNWTRTTGLMAMTLATLHELSGGRVALGIGAYWDPLARNQGIRRRRHLAAMREYVAVVRRLLNMETVNLDGEVVKVQDLRLDLGDGMPRDPIYIGATGPRMLELAGEIGDGVFPQLLYLGQLPPPVPAKGRGWSGAGRPLRQRHRHATDARGGYVRRCGDRPEYRPARRDHVPGSAAAHREGQRRAG